MILELENILGNNITYLQYCNNNVIIIGDTN